MLGAIRKTVIGGTALGLLALGMGVAPAPVHAAPVGDNNACVITESPADVFNIEMFGKTPTNGHSNQAAKGSFMYNGVTMPRFGLYYPVTDPTANHATPRQESFGGEGSIPATPVQTGDHFLFSQSGKCANSQFSFDAGGSAIGYCGRSVGLGVGHINGRSTIIRWESAGSQLNFLDPTARGSVNARPNPPNDPKGSCSDGTAITFTVDGALATV